ncbi:MAG: bifunctional hydroxymethylpyrimidine kinase/phosphomethylpyrimidine kinase [Gemmatimonadota bacterium]
MTARRTLDLSLYFVVSSDSTAGRPLCGIVSEAVRGGVTAVQLRRKGGSIRDFVAEGRELLALLRPLGVPLIVNDRPDVALVVGADGLHVGQDDMAPADVRRVVGPDLIVGLSVTSLEDAAGLDAELVDYAGVGPVFPTTSKRDAATALGLDGLRRIAKALSVPTVAIGGINRENAEQVRATGVAGIAVMAAIGTAERPAVAAASLRARSSQSNRIPNVLAIAGSDPSGGAGIQADLKTFAALGVYGCAAVTALTAQNTRGVFGVLPTSAAFLGAQLTALCGDIDLGAIKIGMLATGPNAQTVAAWLAHGPSKPVVLDPVLCAGTGARLLDDEGIRVLRTELFRRVTVATPNADEAGALLGGSAPATLSDAADAARALHALGLRNVLVTGGHLAEGADCVDLLYDGAELVEIKTPRIEGPPTHGTGCTLSSAIAALLARGRDLRSACTEAQRFVALAIEAAADLTVGSGNRPVHQLGSQWRQAGF